MGMQLSKEFIPILWVGKDVRIFLREQFEGKVVFGVGKGEVKALGMFLAICLHRRCLSDADPAREGYLRKLRISSEQVATFVVDASFQDLNVKIVTVHFLTSCHIVI